MEQHSTIPTLDNLYVDEEVYCQQSDVTDWFSVERDKRRRLRTRPEYALLIKR